MKWVTVARGPEGQSSTFIHHQIRPPRCNEGKLVQEKGQLPGTERKGGGGGPPFFWSPLAAPTIGGSCFKSCAQKKGARRGSRGEGVGEGRGGRGEEEGGGGGGASLVLLTPSQSNQLE